MTQLTSAAVVASAKFLGNMQLNASLSTNLYSELEQKSISNSRTFAMSVAEAIVDSGAMDAQISMQECASSAVNAATSLFSAGLEGANEAIHTKKFDTGELEKLTQMKKTDAQASLNAGGTEDPQNLDSMAKALVKSKGLDEGGNVLSSSKKYVVSDDKLKQDDNGADLQKIFDKLNLKQKESFLKQTNDVISRKTNDRYEAQRKFSQFNTIGRDIAQNTSNSIVKGQFEAPTKARKASYDKDNSLESNAQNMNDTVKQKQDAALQKANDDASRAAESLINSMNQFGRG
ncbi:MAG: hypothetical protein ACOYL1_00810 [Chlamydiia bacterium]